MRIIRTTSRPLGTLAAAFRPRGGDSGMATAEYAIGTCAAAGFGGLLFKLLTGDSVANLLGNVIEKALEFVFWTGHRGDAGMVTAETALALPALLLVLGFAVTVQSVFSARASCADAARAGARAAARGDSDAVVADTVRRVLPRATDVRVRREGALVRVDVRARPATFVPRVPVPLVSADAVAADESAS